MLLILSTFNFVYTFHPQLEVTEFYWLQPTHPLLQANLRNRTKTPRSVYWGNVASFKCAPLPFVLSHTDWAPTAQPWRLCKPTCQPSLFPRRFGDKQCRIARLSNTAGFFCIRSWLQLASSLHFLLQKFVQSGHFKPSSLPTAKFYFVLVVFLNPLSLTLSKTHLQSN